MSTLSEINREHAARILFHLSQQRASGTHCDVCVCVGEQRFLAHKCVLSANSDKLSSLIVEATGEDGISNDIEIEIQGISSVGFEILLNFFYCGVLCLEPNTVSHTWMTAAYLGLNEIVDKCNTYCQSSIRTSVASPMALQKFAKKTQPKPIASKVNPNRRLSKKQRIDTTDEMRPIQSKLAIADKNNSNWPETHVQPNMPGGQQQLVQIISSTTPQTWDSQQQQHRIPWPDEANRDRNLSKREPQTTSTIVSNTESTNIGDENSSSPVSYTTLSLVQQQQPQDTAPDNMQQNVYTTTQTGNHPRQDSLQMDTVSVPVHSNTTRLITIPDGLQHDGINTMVTTATPSDESEQMIFLQVKQLRLQQQQLQQLHEIGKIDDASNPNMNNDDSHNTTSNSKRKRKAPTKISKSEDIEGGVKGNELVIRRSRSLAGTGVVQAVPQVNEEFLELLYKNYPDVNRQPPQVGTNDVAQLLQRGKARQRKSSEQNALNNTVRSILDATNITESSDARVPDAVILIMDRFQALRDNINDNNIRKQLTLKIKHSIHCKKWRVKRQSLNNTQTKSTDNSNSDDKSPPKEQMPMTWIPDPKSPATVNIPSINDVKPTTQEIRQSWLADAKNTNTTVNCDPITTGSQEIIDISES